MRALISSAGTEVWVLAPDAPPAASDCAPSWGEVFRLALGGELAPVRVAAATEAAEQPGRRAAERQLRRRYLEVLVEVTGGRPLELARAGLGEADRAFERALAFYRPDQVFLNPDCGFGCFANRCVNDESTAAAKIRNLVAAARTLRDRHG